MTDISLHSDKVPYCHFSSSVSMSVGSFGVQGAVCLQQVTLDVEIWVNKTLQTELTSQGMSYHSLTDYDLQLAEVYTVKNSDYCVPAHAMFCI